MPWTIQKEFRFEAAHKLPQHDGKCRELHGHSWVGRIEVRGDALVALGPKGGMLLDFSDVKAAVAPLVEDLLDHHYLNDTLPLENPTSEAIAAWLFGELEPQLPGLYAVEIDETCTSSCRFQRDP
jgi:6-pyruvoyltetrahydropterin/6-carboxytetrahydropterin synthase